MKNCKVTEAELALDLGNLEIDIMDSLQVVSDVTVWVWIQSLHLVLFVSGKGQERCPASLRQLHPC